MAIKVMGGKPIRNKKTGEVLTDYGLAKKTIEYIDKKRANNPYVNVGLDNKFEQWMRQGIEYAEQPQSLLTKDEMYQRHKDLTVEKIGGV